MTGNFQFEIGTSSQFAPLHTVQHQILMSNAGDGKILPLHPTRRAVQNQTLYAYFDITNLPINQAIISFMFHMRHEESKRLNMHKRSDCTIEDMGSTGTGPDCDVLMKSLRDVQLTDLS